MNTFDSGTSENSFRVHCLMCEEGLSSVTLVASNSYRTGLVWTVLSHSGLIYLANVGNTAAEEYNNAYAQIFLPDGRLIPFS